VKQNRVAATSMSVQTSKTNKPQITPVDRFSLTLCLAIIAHGIVILGVTFSSEESIQPKYETMEIILVQEKSKAAEDADFLAQANLEGGGDTDEKLSPATPMPAPFPDQRAEITTPPSTSSPPPDKNKSESSETTPAEKKVPVDTEKFMAVEKVTSKVTALESRETKKNMIAKTDTESQKEQEETKELPSATALLTSSFKIASLSAEIQRKLEEKAKRPKRKFISASTREYKYAAYMEAWRAKVERVGNLNYPDSARKNKLTGSLILDVALNADGSVNQINVRRSSGSKILDDAAIRIVDLSSPFAPFPDNIKAETDILHITRTWQFLDNNLFR